jgi:hypothetical protein
MMYKGPTGACSYIATSRLAASSFAKNVNSWLIADGVDTDLLQPGNLQFCIPGDILVLSGDHIAIVLDVKSAANANVARENIRFIHAGQGSAKEYQVITNKVWRSAQGLGSDYFRYQVRRIRTF